MSDINKEMDEMAETLEKSQKSIREIILELGPEGIRKALPTLSAEEQEALKAELEEIKKAKATSMDKNYDPKIREGKITETLLQEDEVDDDKDEKLVKEENKDVDHQGDSSPEGISGQVIKSILSDISDINDVDDSDLSDLAKSFDNNLDQLADYLTNDDEEMLEKAKVVSRMGIRYYADGKSAGKKVGSVRGDKASINSIERARKKGKITDKGASKGIETANYKKEQEDRAKKFKEKTNLKIHTSGSNISLDDIKHNAAVHVAEKKWNKDISDAHAERQKRVAPEKDALNAVRDAAKTKKDGSYHKKDQAKVSAAYDKLNEAKDKDNSQYHAKLDQVREDKNANIARLKEKRANMMKKSIEELNNDETLLTAFVEAALEKGKSFEELIKACEDKGIDVEKVKKVAKKESKEEVKEHVEDMHDKKADLVEKSLEEEILADLNKSMPKGESQALLKARSGGRNHSFSVNSYYDSAIEASKKEETVLKKSSKEGIEDLIEKSQDQSWDQIGEAKQLEANKAKVSGKLVKSFSDEDMDALFPKEESEDK